ncbi:XRE family transcriptional regulator [Actinoplanes rectilineatus]|uniref:XRE family transcriptional regulator n=1 Tax=Actinoplanes rectilineatus TaxID=113571 RepID=UPI000ADD5304|nr:XRE family transcriptional regulator [Actinoplanes rectilineatus]
MNSTNSSAAIPGHVLKRGDMRDALARHDFGQVFALARQWGGISYSRIAAACQIKPERVGSLARGIGTIASYEKIAAIADGLAIPGHMLGLTPRLWETRTAGGTPDNPRDGDGTMLRRDIFKTAAISAGLAIGLPLGGSIRKVDTTRLGLLRQRTATLRQLDNILGGGDTFPIYLREYQATRRIIRDAIYTDSIGTDLVSLLAEQAQQAGWAAFDAGDQDVARRLYEESQDAARQAGDKLLEGNAYAFLAYQQLGTDLPTAVKNADASCEAAGDTAVGSAGALLNERRAWAHALAGNAKETAAALDRAREVITQGNDRPNPDWSAWVDDTELQIMTGRCWTELKRPLRAVPVLKTVLAGFDDTYARDKALYSTWLAASYFDAGEIEECAATADRILDLTAGVASVRPRQQLAPVLMKLQDHKDLPEVAAVLEKARG